MLRNLDDLLDNLRTEYAEMVGNDIHAHTSRKAPDYAAWIDSDLPRARRLVNARESAIASVKASIAQLCATPAPASRT